MTAVQMVRRRYLAARVQTLTFAVLILLAAVAAVIAATGAWTSSAQSAQVTVPLAPAQRMLLAATTGDQSIEVRAIGEQARLINASLPFSQAPVQAARPFAAGGDALDHRRALLCLTQAVYYEAGYEPIDGRRAVAQVVINRMRHPAYPKSVCGVVYQRNSTPVCQFSFVCDGSLLRAPAAGPWRVAEDIARAALAGYVERSVGSATHYHADYVAPRWAPMLSKVAKLGVHIFYRWPGAWGMPHAFNGRYIGEPYDPASLRPVLNLAVLKTVNGTAIPAGPPIPRAENDVGGLLDTSKGWTLNIPLPSDASSGAARMIAEQQARAATKPTEVAAATSGPPVVVAAR